MKPVKYVFSLLIGTAMLSSCTNDLEMEDGDNIRLAFGVAGIEESVNTRGSIITGDASGKFSGNLKLYVAKDEGASAVAKFADASKVYNVLSSTPGPGLHNTLVKWPSYGLAFYAFAPATATYNSDYPTVEPTPVTPSSTYNTYNAGSYTVPAYASQKDLLFAFTPVRTLAVHGTDVPLTLNHILSRITFQIRKPATGENGAFNSETLTLVRLSLVNVKSTSTGTFGNGAANTTTRFDWTTPTGKQTYTMTFSPASAIGDAAFSAQTTYLNAGSGDSMFMLPHGNSSFVETNVNGAIVPGDDSLLEIEYRISTEATNRTAQFKLKTVIADHKWEMGKWTNYQITIKANYIVLNPITVASWGTANPVPVTVE